MGCRIINSPVTGKEVESKTWSDIRNLVESDSEADRYYDQLTSQSFTQWFGNWIEAPSLIKQAQSIDLSRTIYGYAPLGDREQIMFEIAIQANSSKSEKRGAIEVVGADFVKLSERLYPTAKVGDKFAPAISTIVTDHGEPLIAYHASKEKFEAFKKDKISDSEKWSDNKGVFNKMRFLLEKPSSFGFFFTRDRSYVGGVDKNVYPTFLSIKKPLIAQANEESKFWSSVKTEDFDGAIWDDKLEIIAYEPNQIKSVFNEGEYSADENIYHQVEGTETSKASKETLSKVNEFFKRNDIQVETLQSITDADGKRLGVNGVADLFNKLVQVTEGKEDVALTEEAMHFAVSLIKQSEPTLFMKMMSAVDKYQVYRQTFDAYKTVYTKDGKPDIVKIKEEAVGKVLAEYVLKQNGDVKETSALVAMQESFWDKIKNLIKRLLGNTFNPFHEAATTALELEGRILPQEFFYQITDSKQHRLYEDIATQKGVQIQRIEGKDESGKDSNWYEIAGKKVENRVTDLAKRYYERLFGDKEIKESEYEAAVNELKRDTGVKGHADMENIFHTLIDDNGQVRVTPTDDSNYVSQISPNDRRIYNTLKKNLTTRITEIEKAYPGTRFLSETIIHDPNRFGGKGEVGTIDMMYITPDAKVGILDWKFIDLNTKRYDDVPWFKVKAWRIQIGEYKRILKDVYGVPADAFLQTRAIPIVTKYRFSTNPVDKTTTGKVESILIGEVNTKLEDSDYLLPVGLEEESTGNKNIDVLIKKLNSYYDKISDRKVTSDPDKRRKADLLNGIYSAIRNLQIRQNVVPLIDQAKLVNKEADAFMSYVTSLEDAQTELTDREKSDIADSLAEIQETLLTFSDIDIKLKNIFPENISEEEKQIKSDIAVTATEAREKLEEVNEINEEFMTEIVAEPLGVEKLMTTERVVKGFERIFNSTNLIPIRTLQAVYKLRDEAKHQTDFAVSQENENLLDIKKSYMDWAKGKGLSATSKDLFNLIKKDDKNELINQFDSKFYTELKTKIKQEDAKWVRQNVDMPAYEDHIAQQYYEELRRIEDRNYTGDEQSVEREKDLLKDKAAKEFTLDHPQSYAFLNYQELKKFPLKTWESKEFKELNKAENKPALKFYNYIKERNEYYQSIGYISKPQARVFLPFVEKSFTEKLVFGGKVTLGEQFLKNISVDEGTVGFGNIDPITKEVIDGLPKYLTHDTDREVSTDLFRTIGLYNEMATRFKFLSDIEGQVRALARIERAKEVVDTNNFSRVRRDKLTGEIETVKNTQNTALVDAMIKATIYDQKYINSEVFDQALGKVGKWGERLNEKLGYNIFPTKMDGRIISANKSIDTINRIFQQKILGINVLSSISNLLGGNFNAIINAGRYFTKGQFIAAEARLTLSKLSGEDGRKVLAAVDYFMPLTESQNRDDIKELSLSRVSQEKVQDWLMALMRNSDRFVQTSIFLANLDNLILIDNQILNAREYVRKTSPEFSNRYNLSEKGRKASEDAFEKQVKQLVSDKGLMKQASLDEKGKLVVPGVERNSTTVHNVRRVSQNLSADALGNLPEGNARMINLTIYGKSFMIFKNWIPRLADERFGKLKYNSASDAYEWGKARTFFRVLGNQFALTAKIFLKSLAFIDGTGTQQAVDAFRDLYEKKRKEHEDITGEPLEMTETEFIDLVRQNIRSQMRDFLFYGGMMALWIGAKAVAPIGEDKRVKAYHNFLVKALDKFSDEVGFFYNPMSFQQILNGSVFPSLGMATDIYNVTDNFMREMYGLTLGDEKIQDAAHPIKYLLKSFPVSNQISSYLPMLYPDMAKDLGIKSSTQSRMR